MLNCVDGGKNRTPRDPGRSMRPPAVAARLVGTAKKSKAASAVFSPTKFIQYATDLLDLQYLMLPRLRTCF